MNTILQTKDLVKYYGSGKILTKALYAINMEVEEGEFTAIMGPSGSGKSTLLNVISTIDNPSAGEVWIDGNNTASMNEKQLSQFRRDRLGFIFQDYNLLETLTVEENIVMPLNLKKLKPSKIQNELEHIAQVFDIKSQLKKFPKELSGGQSQRVACARALITSPAVILADEPTGALDSANSVNLMRTFNMMNENYGATILMVTHDAMVGSYAKRVLFLKDGHIWNEIRRGSRSRREMYAEIMNVVAAFGGEPDAM